MDRIKFVLKKAGFTLIEILIASFIMTVAFAGILAFTAQYLKGLETTRNFSIAINAAQERMERIKAQISPTDETQKLTKFENLTQYNKLPFKIYAQDGITELANFKGISYITGTMTTPVVMYRLKVVVWWQESGGRTMGEDRDFNGTLDSAEDTWMGPQTAAGEIDSPVSLQTNVVNME